MNEESSKPDPPRIASPLAIAASSAALAILLSVALRPSAGAPDFVQFLGRFTRSPSTFPSACSCSSLRPRGSASPRRGCARASILGSISRSRSSSSPRPRRSRSGSSWRAAGLSVAARRAPPQLHPRGGDRLGGEPRRVGARAPLGLPRRARRHRPPAHGGRALRRLDDARGRLPRPLRPALRASAAGRSEDSRGRARRRRPGDQRRAARLRRRSAPDAPAALRRVSRRRSASRAASASTRSPRSPRAASTARSSSPGAAARARSSSA